jgi:hypothetical protein
MKPHLSRRIGYLSALLIGTLLLPTGNALAEPDEEKEDRRAWTDMRYAVTRAELKKIYAMPPIVMAADFSFKVIVPPGGKLFDPFDFHVVDPNTILASDDGKSGYIWKVKTNGTVTPLSSPKRWAPYTFDVAPPSFGKFAGQIYAVGFNEPEKAGGWDLPNAVTRIDPKTGNDTLICYLPINQDKEPGAGSFFARFGPEGSPFAGKLWITTASNHTIYQVTPDGKCAPFIVVDLAKQGSPRGINFTKDGQSMLVGATAPASDNRAKTGAGGAKIWRMSPAGVFADQPLVSGLHEPGPMAFAPEGFGTYGGELFITDAGDWNNDIGIVQSPNIGPTDTVNNDGRVFRVTKDGKVELVASGLRNPVALAFSGKSLLVGDINGDFHVGYQKFPDGFIVAIAPR